jgi:hypothetical protein
MGLKPGETLSNGEFRHGSGVPDGAHYKECLVVNLSKQKCYQLV